MKLYRILLAVLLLVCPLFADAKKPSKASNEKIKVMSFNLRFVTPKDTSEFHWTARREPVVQMLTKVCPDVVSFQENGQQWQDYLQKNLPDYVFYLPENEGFEPLPKGTSLLVCWRKGKYEKVDAGRFFLSETPEVPSTGFGSRHYRNTVWVKLKNLKTGKEFYVFDTHLDHKAALAKEKGAQMNVEMAKKIVGEDIPVFFMGDMNIRRESSIGHYLNPYYEWMKSTADNAKKAENTPTSNGFGKRKTMTVIDYLFYRHAVPLKYEVINEPDYGVKYISDHWPIMGTFKF